MNTPWLLMRVLSLVFVGLAILPARAQNDAAGERKKLVGVWRGGWPEDKKPRYEIVITLEEITAKNLEDGKDLGKGTYKVDPAGKTLDATGTGDPVKGKAYMGIYALDGETLKWCSNNGTRKRPADLAHKPGGDQYLLVLKRQKP